MGEHNIEREALTEFYYSTQGPNWIKDDHWGTDAPVSQWHGVTVDKDNHVTELTLYDNNLSGPIPPSFFTGLTKIKTLYFSFNRISGCIPPEIGNCKDLENVWLKGNMLTGSIPREIGNCTKLLWFDLHVNKLSGPIPQEIGNCVRLGIIRLEDNELSGPIPESIFVIPSLTELYLHRNNLVGSIPTSIGKASLLKYLFLNENGLEGAIPDEIGELRNLAIASLHSNKLSHVPRSIVNIPSLLKLRLENNNLKDVHQDVKNKFKI